MEICKLFQTGPIRLFVPYKRRKKDSDSAALGPVRKKSLLSAKSTSQSTSREEVTSPPSSTSPAVSVAAIVGKDGVSATNNNLSVWKGITSGAGSGVNVGDSGTTHNSLP